MELKRDANLLEDEEVLNAMLNTTQYNNTLLEPQTDIDPRQVKKLKQVYAEAFDESCPYKEGKDVARAFKSRLNQMAVEVNQLLSSKSSYPFLASLESFAAKLDRRGNKDYSYYLSQIHAFEDELLDAKEDVLDPVKRFMNGEQRTIYESIRNLLNGDTSNLGYIEGDELKILTEVLKNTKPYAGNLMKEAKAAKDSLNKKVLDRIKEEREAAIKDIEQAIDNLKSKDEFRHLDTVKQQRIVQPLQEII